MAGEKGSLDGYSTEEVAGMASTYEALLKNPETRELALRLTKKVDPNLSVPEIDLKDQARAAFQETNKKIESLEDQIRKSDARDRIERERKALRDTGLNDDDVAAVEKMMVTEQIPSYGTAAKLYRAERELAAATPSQGAVQQSTTYQLPESALAAGKSGKGGLSQFARNEADAAMNDLRSGRIKLH